jgi:hypothetical protein
MRMSKWHELLKANGITPGKREVRPMGQGFFTVLAWGAVAEFDDGNDGNNRYDWVQDAAKAHGIRGRTAYEARQRWLGFFVAENGSGVSRDGDGCELFSYEVFDVADLGAEVERRWPGQLAKCKAAYEDLRTTAAKHGIELPAGRLMLVNDYD